MTFVTIEDAFERQQTLKVLLQWCEENGIVLD
jgi:hypothetical protein